MSNSVTPMNCSPPGSSVYRSFQARILECVAISYSRGSSWPRDWTYIPWIGRYILYHWATWKALLLLFILLAIFFLFTDLLKKILCIVTKNFLLVFTFFFFSLSVSHLRAPHYTKLNVSLGISWLTISHMFFIFDDLDSFEC